jgi:hypothetical protein
MSVSGKLVNRTARLVVLAGFAASGYADATASAGLQATPTAVGVPSFAIMTQHAGPLTPRQVAVSRRARTVQPAVASMMASPARFRLQTATLAQAVRDFDHSSFVLHPAPPPAIKASIRNDVISAMNAYSVNGAESRSDTTVALHEGRSAYLRVTRPQSGLLKVSSIR